ncbi:MAG: DNA/RNA nuclease SfsA [Thermodesulfobacteriota bacterium]
MATNKILVKSGGLPWPKLYRGTLVKRYKRFLADVQLDNGSLVTAHCPNSGTMRACSAPGRPVYLSFHDNPKRKLKYTWELIHMPDSLVGVNTLVPNRLVKQAVEDGQVKALKGYDRVRAEVKTSDGSRLDLMLEKDGKSDCFVEIKNCTLVEGCVARFPDAVTARGRKHLVELQRLVSEGNRGVMFFLIQRMDADSFSPADDIDPVYGQELRKAHQNGVDILVYDVSIDLTNIQLSRQIPFFL